MYWYKVIAHDYMDEYPVISFRLFESSHDAISYEKHMNENYSGGTTSVAPAIKSEVLDYIKKYDIKLDAVRLKEVHDDENYRFSTC